MKIDVDFTFDLTSINTDVFHPELFVVTSSEFGDGEIVETVTMDLFQAVNTAFEAYFLDDQGFVGDGDQRDILGIVTYLEEVAGYAREFYTNLRFVGVDDLKKQ